MKQINLVPVAVRQKAASQKVLPYIVLACALGIGAAGAAWAGLAAQESLAKAEKEKLVEQQEARQRENERELASLQIDGDIKGRVDQLNTLAKQDIDWQKAFDYVAGITPKDITLLSYSLATSTNGTALKLTGEAPTNVSYATFVEYLKSQMGKLVTSYKVEGYTYDPRTGRVSFQIAITVPASEIKFTTAP